MNDETRCCIESAESNINKLSAQLREIVFMDDDYDGDSLKEILRRATLIRMYADILIKEVSFKL